MPAQPTGSYSYSYDEEGDPASGSPTTQVSSIPEIATRLASMNSLCTGSGGYTVDCLAERIEALEQDAANIGGHTELKQILRDTAEELRNLARENRDPAKPRARLIGPDGQQSTRPLVAVAPDRRRGTHERAIAILEEAETRLLRSSTQSVERANQYQQVAQALGSNKVLLRS
ncbi:hypothetical protein [Pseudophaeobacter sp.]|uniref:hypothetical protein n=1 Tax=Pseudophaeobacter sp. TaxID=1971739 RepID=UPI0032971618